MPEADLFLLFVRPLNHAGIRYVVSGSVAAIFYGEPRLTHDVDFICFLNESEVHGLVSAFPPQQFYVPPGETLAVEVAREQRGHFNIIHKDTGFKADFYLAGQEKIHAWAFRQKRQIDFEGEQIWLAPPEYVIVRKLEYFREGGSEKHLRDVRSMLALSSESLDRTLLLEWIAQRGLQAEWQSLSP
jgi:hypothetical protein